MMVALSRRVNIGRIMILPMLAMAVIAGIGAAKTAHAAPASGSPKVVYTGPRLTADGKVHEFKYPIVCSDGTSGCYVKITVIATRVTDLNAIPAGVRQVAAQSPLDPPVYYHLVDTYETCTGPFGSCIAYTKMTNDVRFELIDGNVNSVYGQIRTCSAGGGWSCQATAGGFVMWGYSGPGSALSGYGAQGYINGGSHQAKYANILMNEGGSYQFLNTCAGALC